MKDLELGFHESSVELLVAKMGEGRESMLVRERVLQRLSF